jgi:hypothetical protein
MNMAKKKMKISKKMREWRAHQGPGDIMKPSTFETIRRRAAASGARNPEEVAGKAYWGAVKAQFKQRHK